MNESKSALGAYNMAEAFRDAAWMLSKRLASSDMEDPIRLRMTMPVVVNEAFAIELYLKSLIILENKKKATGHDLEELFDKLELETQALITAYFDERMARNPKAKMMQALGLNIALDIRSCLARGKDAFVSYRYAHETPKGRSGDKGYFLSSLLSAAQRVIIERQPEWRWIISSEPQFTHGQVYSAERKGEARP